MKMASILVFLLLLYLFMWLVTFGLGHLFMFLSARQDKLKRHIEVIYGKRVTWKSRGYFFHENPSNQIGDTQKYQKKLHFWSKTCFFWALKKNTFLKCCKPWKSNHFIFALIWSILVCFGLCITLWKRAGNIFLVPKAQKPQVKRKKIRVTRA